MRERRRVDRKKDYAKRGAMREILFRGKKLWTEEWVTGGFENLKGANDA